MGNIGPTQLVSPRGEVVSSLEPMKSDWMFVEIPVEDPNNKTIYTKFGNIIFLIAFAGLAGSFGYQFLTKKEE